MGKNRLLPLLSAVLLTMVLGLPRAHAAGSASAIDAKALNALLAKSTQCFEDWAFRGEGEKKGPPCFKPEGVFRQSRMLRKPSKKAAESGTDFEIRVPHGRPMWKPISPDLDSTAVPIVWLPGLECFLTYVSWYGENGDYQLLRGDGEMIPLHGAPVLSADGQWLATAGTDPYDESGGVALSVFQAGPGMRTAKPAFDWKALPGTAFRRPNFRSLRWRSPQAVEIEYEADGVSYVRSLDAATGQLAPVMAPGAKVGTLEPATVIRSKPSSSASPLAVVPFAARFEAVSVRGEWIEVRFGKGQSGFVHGSLADALPKEIASSSLCELSMRYSDVLDSMGKTPESEERHWAALSAGTPEAVELARKTRDMLERWAFCSPDRIEPRLRGWLKKLAFDGVPGLPGIYADAPKRFLERSPAFAEPSEDGK
jgi:hypothetical protein